MKIVVLGAGSWGTALAHHCASIGHETTVWAFEEEVVSGINTNHKNPMYMSQYDLPASLKATSNLQGVLDTSELVISVIPTQFLRSVLKNNAARIANNVPILSASKGIEISTLDTPTQIIAEHLTNHDMSILGAIAGPSFAKEVIEGHPTTVVLSLKNQQRARELQHELSGERLRVYRSDDIIGAEYCGALKNVIAIASGTVDGLGFGDNTRAALITRGLSEITRLIITMGGRRSTVAGIAGIGDMVLTCTSSTSRNYTVGYKLGQGENLDDIITSMKMVAEGVKTTKSACELAQRMNVEMPITEAMHEVLYNKLDPRTAVQQLMSRALKHEWEIEE